MKITVQNRNYFAHAIRSYPYPNAAEPGYFANRLLDQITAVATIVGVITIFFFLATM